MRGGIVTSAQKAAGGEELGSNLLHMAGVPQTNLDGKPMPGTRLRWPAKVPA